MYHIYSMLQQQGMLRKTFFLTDGEKFNPFNVFLKYSFHLEREELFSLLKNSFKFRESVIIRTFEIFTIHDSCTIRSLRK